jgi:hypothetical protein
MDMSDEYSFRGLLHRATHRIPGVPAHTERPAGHQDGAHEGSTPRRAVAAQPSLNHRWNHSPARPPRVIAAWQSWIAAFFGQELR